MLDSTEHHGPAWLSLSEAAGTVKTSAPVPRDITGFQNTHIAQVIRIFVGRDYHPTTTASILSLRQVSWLYQV